MISHLKDESPTKHAKKFRGTIVLHAGWEFVRTLNLIIIHCLSHQTHQHFRFSKHALPCSQIISIHIVEGTYTDSAEAYSLIGHGIIMIVLGFLLI